MSTSAARIADRWITSGVFIAFPGLFPNLGKNLGRSYRLCIKPVRSWTMGTQFARKSSNRYGEGRFGSAAMINVAYFFFLISCARLAISFLLPFLIQYPASKAIAHHLLGNAIFGENGKMGERDVCRIDLWEKEIYFLKVKRKGRKWKSQKRGMDENRLYDQITRNICSRRN